MNSHRRRRFCLNCSGEKSNRIRKGDNLVCRIRSLVDKAPQTGTIKARKMLNKSVFRSRSCRESRRIC